MRPPVQAFTSLSLVMALVACARRPEKLIIGNWTVSAHVEPANSVMSAEQADGWRGSRATFTTRRL